VDNPQMGLVGTDSFSDEPVAWTNLPGEGPPAQEVTLQQAVIMSRFAPSSVLVRRECLERAGPFDPGLKSVEDRDMWIRIAACDRMATIHLPLTWYRQTPGSMSRNAERMERYERAVLERAFSMPALRGRWLLRQKARGLAAYSAAWMYLDSGEKALAWRRMISSFLQWPLPIFVPDVRVPFGRVRLLVRSSLAGVFQP
jgi:hypothetical protein